MDWFSQINDTTPFDWTDPNRKAPPGPPAWSLRRETPAPARGQQQPQPQERAIREPGPSAAPPKSQDWFSELNGVGATEPRDSPQSGKSEGWGEWIANSIRGRQDPKEAGTGTVFDQYPNELGNPTANAAIFGADDAGMGDIIQKSLGDKFIRRETDANGYEIMVTRGPDGQERRGYVNRPGLDTQDVSRAAYGSLPYIATGGATGAALKGAGVGVQALGQAAAGGATSVGGDIASGVQGSEQGVDAAKAGIMAGFGAAGPVAGMAAGALWRKFVTVPGLVDKATGKLTARGVEAAKRAGVDPNDITPDFAKSFAKTFAETGNPQEAAVRADASKFGIRVSPGQATKRKDLLHTEEAMRWGKYGDKARTEQDAFDILQREELRKAAMGGNPSASQPSIGAMVAPHRKAGDGLIRSDPKPIGEDIQAALQGARQSAANLEDDAWRGATSLEITPEAAKDLPDILNAKLGGRLINERANPAAFEMAQEVQRIIAGEAPEKAAGWVANSPTKNVDQMRRNLFELYKSADNTADKAASKAIYEGFNDWITTSAEKKLLAGDPEAALKLVNARGFTKEVRSIFEPQAADGAKTAAARRIGAILDPAKVDSGESVIQELFGSKGSRTITQNGVATLKNIKTAFDRFLPKQEATQAWNDVRLAYWARLVAGKNGETMNPLQLSSTLKEAMTQQRSVMATLFSPGEFTEIRRFARAVDAIAYKPPNASGSSYGVDSFAREAIGRITNSLMTNRAAGIVINAAASKLGLTDSYGAVVARRALARGVKPVRPNVTPAITGAGQAAYRSQSGNR